MSAQRTSSRSPKAVLIVGAATILLGGCFGRDVCELEPLRFPVYGEPQHIFADPIGYHYTDIVPHKNPLTNEPLRREPRPAYPISVPAPAPAPTVDPTVPTGPALPNTPPPPVSPQGRTTLPQPPQPTAVKPQTNARPLGLRGSISQSAEMWTDGISDAAATEVRPASLALPPSVPVEARPTVELRRGTLN